MEGWVDLGYPAMHRPGTELAISRSPVRRPNHYTTEQPIYVSCVIYVLNVDYSDSRAVECINNDLVNTLCNLVSRCSAKSLNPLQIFPDFDQTVFNHLALDSEKDIMTHLYELAGQLLIHIQTIIAPSLNLLSLV